MSSKGKKVYKNPTEKVVAQILKRHRGLKTLLKVTGDNKKPKEAKIDKGYKTVVENIRGYISSGEKTQSGKARGLNRKKIGVKRSRLDKFERKSREETPVVTRL